MPEIDVFDGHCDTVLKCCLEGGGFGRNSYHVDLERGRAFRRYAQFFALFGQPEDFPGLTPGRPLSGNTSSFPGKWRPTPL